MSKFRFWKIMMCIILVFLSIYANASKEEEEKLLEYTSVSTGNKKDETQKSYTLSNLSPEMMGMIIQYLNFHEFLQVMCTRKAYYDIFEGKKVADFLKYMDFLITPTKINHATVIQWMIQYSKTLRSQSNFIDIQKKFLATRPIVFFTGFIYAPKILCPSMNTGTKKEIEIFFQKYKYFRFAGECFILPAVYHPGTSILHWWSCNGTLRDYCQCRIYLPRVLIFGALEVDTIVHIEQISTWTISSLIYDTEKNNKIITWNNRLFGNTLAMEFDNEGVLFRLTKKMNGKIQFSTVKGENNEYTIYYHDDFWRDGQEKYIFTKIIAFYYPHDSKAENIE